MLLLPAAILAVASFSAASPLLHHEQLAFQPPPVVLSTDSSAHATPYSTLTAHEVAQFKAYIEANDEPRLVRIAPNGVEQSGWSTEGEKALLRLRGINFVDITDHREMWESPPLTTLASGHVYPQTLTHSAVELASLFKNISTTRMKATLTEFSGFRTRYYRSADGKKSQQWLLAHVEDIAKRSTATKITVEEFSHPWGQNSIIARIEKRRPSFKKDHGEVVIISAHQDSTNLLPFLGAPGADDDGSGTTTILESFATLVANDYVPANHTLEFHWYSAEEGGLLGSQAVAAAYKAKGQKVRAMVQFDMTAYVKPGTEERIGVIQDFVDPDLTSFMERLVDEYAEIPWVRTQCGYACSDHASWGKIGAPSAFAIESTFEDSNHNIHSGRDTVDLPGFSFDHMAQFSRLAIGFAFELAGRA